jgi:tetratricopeptide (TPR) repeat protein
LQWLHASLKGQGKTEELEELYRDALQRNDVETLSFVASWAAERKDWTNAAEKLARLTELHPDSVDNLYYVALVQLSCGNEAEYRDACSRLLQVWESKPDKSAADPTNRFIWTFVLAPAAIKDLTVPVEHAAAVLKNQSHAANLTIYGAILYRAGQYDASASRLEEAVVAFPNDTTNQLSPTYAQLFLAMTRWQQGDSKEAKRLLASVKANVEEEVANPATGWNRRATLELLLREAEALIQPETVVSTNPAASSQPKQLESIPAGVTERAELEVE